MKLPKKFGLLSLFVLEVICPDDKENKLKGVPKSQSKHIKFEDDKNCLDGKKSGRMSKIYFKIC